MARLALLIFSVLGLVGCPDRDSGPRDAPFRDAPAATEDTPGLDAPTEDTPGLDAPPFDADLDAPPFDADLDAPPFDADLDVGSDAPLISMPCTATGTCDPFDPSSCPAMQSCRLGATGTACMALAPTVARVGEACTRSDGCEPGATCLDFGSGFTCMRQCPAGSIGFCGAGQTCSGTLGDDCVRVCRPLAPVCDIYAQDCADTALACTLVTNGETGERYTGCRPPGALTEGETCGTGVGNCARGLICVRVAGVSECRAVCNPEAGGPDCTAPATCAGTTTGWGVRFCLAP